MGMYSYSRSRIDRMTDEELDRHNRFMTAALILAGFCTWGITWIGLYIIYEDRLYDSK